MTEHDTNAAGVTPAVPDDVPIWSLPAPQRKKHGSLALGLIWALLFNLGIVLIHTVQLAVLPLSLLPQTRSVYHAVVRASKGWFGRLVVLISQWFAPTTFVISHDAAANVTFKRAASGHVERVVLPGRAIWTANHQTLCDWLYLWTFAYLSGHDDAVFIALKASIKKVPIIGVACNLFGFLFLNRNWTTDKVPFKRQLDRAGEQVMSHDEKLALLIFPEGTLVTGNTRPKSKQFADKLGVPDMRHTLLPRSTGLFFALRTLAKKVPELELVDLTIAYPGPKAPYWPEDYYNLALWFKQVPPPSLHFHIRTFNAVKDIPLGDLSGLDGTEEEKAQFDRWLRDRWREKDDLMATFLEAGSFVTGAPSTETLRWRTELRHVWEVASAFGFFVGLPILYYVVPLLWSMLVRLPFELARHVLASKASGEL